MYIKKLHIENFKGFKGNFDLNLTDSINILVGDNEAGKTTILEAINLALTGTYGGRYLKNNLSSYIFNKEIINEYIVNCKNHKTAIPPYVLIELYFDSPAKFNGDYNSAKDYSAIGLFYKIEFDDRYMSNYESLLESGLESLPMEYYKVTWMSFGRDYLTSRDIPIKPAFIDSSNLRVQNGSDVYISRIIKDILSDSETVDVSQAFRKMQESFENDPSIININNRIKEDCSISDKDVSLSVDYSSREAWADVLTTYINNIPFINIGKGEQCVIKTKLALSNNKTQNSSLLLIEEPENHLSFTKLNELIRTIKDRCAGKQIIISTHSSFVLNKLGLNHLILLKRPCTLKISDLSESTVQYFEKLSGYDTLRLLLSKKTILVEGDSDDLVIQKAYLKKNNKLPIEDGIDIIRVGNLSFTRFLEIAKRLNLNVTVVTDNDGNIKALKDKYIDYKDCPNIKICYDNEIDNGDIERFNYNTMEPKILKSNNRDILNNIFNTMYSSDKDLLKYMKNNKTSCALAIFDSDLNNFTFPKYIDDAIDGK